MGEDDNICRWCGQDFGNAGALTQHERACEGRSADPVDQNTDKPARPAPQQDSQPAPYQGAESAGGTLVDAAMAVADDDLPAQARGQALKGGLGVVGDMFMRYQEYRDRKMQEQKKRASAVELEEVVDFPECDCGYQFDGDDIGLNNEQVRCPSCDRLWQIRDQST